MNNEVNELLDKLGKLEDAPLIWINKKVYDTPKEIERLQNVIKEVREYIKDKWEMELKDSMKDFLDHDELIDRKRLLHILEILDNVGDK